MYVLVLVAALTGDVDGVGVAAVVVVGGVAVLWRCRYRRTLL